MLKDIPYKKIKLENMGELNSTIYHEFNKLDQGTIERKSHYFNGRYENIYIDAKELPSLDKLILILKDSISEFTGVDPKNMKVGYWFNAMGHGHVTTLHCHDELDEILSGVYYIHVPPGSGNLILHTGETVEIIPEEGALVVFKPELNHEVTENRGQEMRLSIGLNVFEAGG